ncbi:hypothetical protein [Streptomyces sp. NRRL WC-3742]|uniref:hypothetical protein n=1 Tax=Streptomyces sp. NRRL WC-3742 TaxID=1463934 RepID=UPI0004C58F9B|nr:hypothetical protein [Streptomyces sp. NRRL WC-3742]
MTTEPAQPAPGQPPTPPAPPAAPPAFAPPAFAPPGAPAPAVPGGAPVYPDTVPAPLTALDVLAAGPEQPPRPPRRPRPVLLSVYALALGVLAGGAVGYAVQAQRPPTPLAPLQVARPAYPQQNVDAGAFAATQPRPPAVEGDLTKLLVRPPSGSTPWGELPDQPSWVSAGDVAQHHGNAAEEFKLLLGTGFRRAAEVDWTKDDIRYRVLLTQYAPEHSDVAAVPPGQPFAPDVEGTYRVFDEPEHWAESTEQFYYGRAGARRGALVMEIEVFSPRPVDPESVKSLAKQQWERLV